MTNPSFKTLLLMISLTLAGCGGGGGGGGGGNSGKNITISMSGVVTLVEQQDASKITAKSLTGAASDTSFTTNLFGLDAAGNITYPLKGDVNVQMVVPGPTQYDVNGNSLGPGELWFILSGTWVVDPAKDPQNADSICQVIRVDIGNNSYDCPIGSATLGYFDPGSFQSIRSDLRPIQFDANDNIYLVKGNPNVPGYSPPVIVKINRSDFSQTALTPDSSNVVTFALLPSGNIVFSGSGGTQLLQNGSVYTISSNTRFMLDDSNTMIFSDGINYEYVTPRKTGGFNRAPGAHGTPWQMGDDGILYGFNNYQGSSVDLISLLPYDPTPIISNLDDMMFIPSYFGNQALQLTHNFAVFSSTKTNPNYGNYDVITLANLTTRNQTVLFDATSAEFAAGAPRYTIFNFKASGDTLLFAALDQASQKVKLGVIDMVKLQNGEPIANYLSFIDVSSAVSATNAVRDMVPINPQQPGFDPAAAPYVANYFFNNSDPSTLGVNFSKYMDKTSVVQNLSLTDVTNGNAAVEYIPFWIKQNLYMIPDTSALGFSDSVAGPLLPNTQYQLTLGSNTLDAYGKSLASGDTATYPLSNTFTTAP